MHWVIAYDVTSNRIRSRVSKGLVKEGIRIQKSVFVVEASSEQVKQLVKELGRLIDLQTDSLCAWPLAEAWRDRQQSCPSDAVLQREIYVIG
jgi:CRISPR-associated endonuclease Cas2